MQSTITVMLSYGKANNYSLSQHRTFYMVKKKKHRKAQTLIICISMKGNLAVNK